MAAALLIAALQITIHAQDSNGTIQGVVRDPAGAPLSDAQVRAVGDSVVVTTDVGPDGAFVFTDVPPGDYRVQIIDSLGRILATTRVRLAAGGITQTVNFTVRTGETALNGAPSEPARFYVGDVGITPAVTLWNLGSDTNVLNETDAAKRDTAFTLTPQAAISLDAKKARGEGSARVDYQYFDKLSSERSLNGTFGGGLEVKLGFLRITPELRYTRWGSNTFSSIFPPGGSLNSNQNQGEFLVGFSF